MSKKLYEESNIQSIASAIRERTKTQDTYKVSEMADAILTIIGGDLPDLDTVSFGNNPTVSNPGSTDPQYYEAIADAINYAIDHGGQPEEQTWNEPIVRNWDFSNPLNRRGKSSYVGEKSIDGWTCASYTTCILDSGGIRVVKHERQVDTNMYYQLDLKTSGILDNKTVTVSMLANNKLATETVVIDPSKLEQTTVVIDGVEMWLYRDSSKRIAVGFNNEGLGDSTLIQAVKLEIGDSQTLATQVDGKWELIKHQNNDAELVFLEASATNI